MSKCTRMNRQCSRSLSLFHSERFLHDIHRCHRIADVGMCGQQLRTCKCLESVNRDNLMDMVHSGIRATSLCNELFDHMAQSSRTNQRTKKMKKEMNQINNALPSGLSKRLSPHQCLYTLFRCLSNQRGKLRICKMGVGRFQRIEHLKK